MFEIVECGPDALEEWVALRCALWPDLPEHLHRSEAEALLRNAGEAVTFLARAPESIGFAEVTLRHDYVNGCDTSPVAFLEGIYVKPEWRRRGVAAALCAAAENWARRLGCAELASDAELHNTVSHRMHAGLGFEETERVVCYRKILKPLAL
jgi:aminoglycoside 6'-N-acetyltransferase I